MMTVVMKIGIQQIMFIYYTIDGGTEQNLLWIESSGDTNTAPAIDTNFDGSGNGTEITDTFANFY